MDSRIKSIIYNIFLFFGIFSASFASAANNVYYSVGQSNSTELMTGSPNVTVVGGVATFNEAQTGNIGVGDQVIIGATTLFISGKVDTSRWNVVTNLGATPSDISSPTAVTHIYRTFASLNDAVTNASGASYINNTSLVAADVVLNIPCYYDTGADVTAVTISGYTTDATRYIKIYTPVGMNDSNTSQRHEGAWNDSKYKLEFNTAGSNMMSISALYVKIYGVQFYSTNVFSSYQKMVNFVAPGGIGVVADSIIRFNLSNLNGNNRAIQAENSGTVSAYNNIIYDFLGSGSVGIRVANNNVYAHNNTFHNCAEGINIYSGTPTAKNNIFHSCITPASGTFAAGTGYNATDDVSIGYTVTGGAVGDRTSQTFTFADEAGDDFHLSLSDTGAKDAGTNLSADADLPFSTDIDSQSRSGLNWDIGADEYTENGAFTVSGWVKMTGTSAASKAIVAKAEELRLVTDGSGNPACQIKSGGAWQTAAVSSSALSLNQWAHVACAYDKSTLKVYVNGTQKDSDSLSVGVDNTSASLKFGADDSSGTTYGDFQGFLDEVRMYPYARSAIQIQFDYNAGLSASQSARGISVGISGSSEKWMSDGLVGYWKMDESSWNGTTGEVLDASGNANHGTASGGATTDVGKFGKGGSFDGAGDYGSLGAPDSLAMNGSNAFTVSAWVFPGNASAATKDVFARGSVLNSADNTVYYLAQSGSRDGAWYGRVSDGVTRINIDTNSGTLVPNVWQQMVLVWNGENKLLSLYKDGELITTSTNPVFTTLWDGNEAGDKNTSIGADTKNTTPRYFWEGDIDETRIYNRALSPDEVQKLYEWAPGPATQIKMDEKISGDAQTLYDASGYQRNATTEQGTNASGMDCTLRGKYGSSCDLDGVDDYLQINDFDY